MVWIISNKKDDTINKIFDKSITDIVCDATIIPEYAFTDCIQLKSAKFPLATNTGTLSFAYCEQLSTIDFPEVTTINSSAFYGCRSLVFVNFPSVNDIGGAAFSSCSNLVSMDLGSFVTIRLNAFIGTNLTTLILRSSTVSVLSDITAFKNTPFASGGTGGTLYVPQALISSYRSATNWSTILGYPNNKILAIEGSPYE